MQKGQTGKYITETGAIEHGVVLRVRGGNQVDVDGGGGAWVRQMVPVGTERGCFWPDGFITPEAPPPTGVARLVPRYVPLWHVLVLGVPVSVGTAVLTVLAWMKWLN